MSVFAADGAGAADSHDNGNIGENASDAEDDTAWKENDCADSDDDEAMMYGDDEDELYDANADERDETWLNKRLKCGSHILARKRSSPKQHLVPLTTSSSLAQRRLSSSLHLRPPPTPGAPLLTLTRRPALQQRVRR